MLVNLPNGKTVDIPFDDYLHMGREGYQFLMANNFGMHLENPFFGAALNNKREEEEEEEDEATDDYLPLEDFED
jgi:hypothetical protein